MNALGLALSIAAAALGHGCRWHGTVRGGQRPNSPIVITITNPCFPGKPRPVGHGRVTIL